MVFERESSSRSLRSSHCIPAILHSNHEKSLIDVQFFTIIFFHMKRENSKKTALITGGTSGVGLSIAKALVRIGAMVYVVGTDQNRGNRVERELIALGPGDAEFISLDLSNLRDVRAFAQKFVSQVPKLDVLANIAGIMSPDRLLTPEGVEKTFAIGHLSAFILSNELRPALAAANHGRIVNVSGPPARLMKPILNFQDIQSEKNYGIMSASTVAVHAKTVMSEILAERFASDNIDVNVFHPGAVKSDLFRSLRFPLNTIFGFARMFMAIECQSGIYVATETELTGTTGQMFVGEKPIPLNFEDDYKERLLTATESILEQAINF